MCGSSEGVSHVPAREARLAISSRDMEHASSLSCSRRSVVMVLQKSGLPCAEAVVVSLFVFFGAFNRQQDYNLVKPNPRSRRLPYLYELN